MPEFGEPGWGINAYNATQGLEDRMMRAGLRYMEENRRWVQLSNWRDRVARESVDTLIHNRKAVKKITERMNKAADDAQDAEIGKLAFEELTERYRQMLEARGEGESRRSMLARYAKLKVKEITEFFEEFPGAKNLWGMKFSDGSPVRKTRAWVDGV